MACHHVRAGSRARSSGSISSSSSESPRSFPAFDFTLYGSPAPRSAHRTSSGATKLKPRRPSTKPVLAPPASPLSTHFTEDLQLDLSSLTTAEDELIIANNGSEIYYRECGIVFNESRRGSRDTKKGNDVMNNSSVEPNRNGGNKSFCSEATETGDLDNIESAGKAIRLIDCGKELEEKMRSKNQGLSTNMDSSAMDSQYSDRGQISSDFVSSSQSFSDEGSGGTGSSLSTNSSCATLSEYSLDSCSTASSLKSRKSHQSEVFTSNCSSSSREARSYLSNKISHEGNKVDSRSVELTVESPTEGNSIQQMIRSLPNENPSRNPGNASRKEASTQMSSGAIIESIMVTDLQIAPSCAGEDSSCISNSFSVRIDGRSEKIDDCVISSACENSCGISTLSIDPLTAQFVEVNERKCELNNDISYVNYENKCISSNKAGDNVENGNINSKSAKIYGHHFLNEGHEIQTRERIIEEERKMKQSCLCCAEVNTKMCSSVSNSFLYHESYTPPSCNSVFCDTSTRRSTSESHFDDIPDENILGMDMISHNKFAANVKAEPASSGLDNPPSCGKYVSLTNLENEEDSDDTFDSYNSEYQIVPGNNQMFQRDLYSLPIRPQTQNKDGSLSVMTCNCGSGRKSRHFLKLLDSGYVPDISLPTGEVMEAVICARQLVCVLERALDWTLSSKTNDRNTDSSVGESSASFPTNFARKMQRPNSSSPRILRRSKETDSACGSTTFEFPPGEKHGVSDADSAMGSMKGMNPKDIFDVKPPFSCDGVGTRRCSYVDAPPLLIVSPEELRKQRTLLKPASDRRVHDAVVQVVDMADILRNTISRRRKFLDPSDEFICGNNRSVSECSLENA